MEDGNNRMYYEIIEEVCNRLAEEGEKYDIDHAMIYSLQSEWLKNLDYVHNNLNKNAIAPVGRNNNEGLKISDDEDADYSPEDEIDAIEQNIGCYMMCLFLKVAKSKNKWKCQFKQGFINVGGDDIPFSNANGELEW
ncbi:hypothetical protein ENBRE01_0764 [Enteropsectra breve]|nr:hypothetical protein ENBRE01_0764 [Enteropsectra breve]